MVLLLLLLDLGDADEDGAGDGDGDDKSEIAVGLFISSGIMLNCRNIGSDEPEPITRFVDFEVRISDTLLAREHRASESIPAIDFRLKT